MLFSLMEIEKYQLYAEGEEVGKIRAFLIDSHSWLVNYMVASAAGRTVILARDAIQKSDHMNKRITFDTQKAKFLDNPEIDLNQPFSRELERDLHDYNDWPDNWEQKGVPETMPGDLSATPLVDMELDKEEKLDPETDSTSNYRSDLWSTKGIFGMTIYAANDHENAGTLVDLIIDDDNWHIQYIVIETNGIFSNHRVALAPQWIKAIDEKHSRILVDLKKATIEQSPSFTSTVDLTPEYLERLRNHYKQ